jgi:hypothetical protein
VPKSVGSRLGRLDASGANGGQNVVEYGLLIATIVVLVLMGTTAFGAVLRPWLEHLAGRIVTVGT